MNFKPSKYATILISPDIRQYLPIQLQTVELLPHQLEALEHYEFKRGFGPNGKSDAVLVSLREEVIVIRRYGQNNDTIELSLLDSQYPEKIAYILGLNVSEDPSNITEKGSANG